MLQTFYGIFIILHGLVHMWYLTLSQRWVPFKAEMGWTGQSWLLSSFLSEAATRTTASILYVLAAIAFLLGGVGVLAQANWWTALVIGSAVFSSAIIVLFWDGSLQMIVEKGLLGLIINVALIVALRMFGWPASRL